MADLITQEALRKAINAKRWNEHVRSQKPTSVARKNESTCKKRS